MPPHYHTRLQVKRGNVSHPPDPTPTKKPKTTKKDDRDDTPPDDTPDEVIPITSSTHRPVAGGQVQGDPLPAERQQLYDKLKELWDELKEQWDNEAGVAPKKHLKDELDDCTAAMASLFLPWSTDGPWSTMVAPTLYQRTAAYNYVSSVSQRVGRILASWKSKRLVSEQQPEPGRPQDSKDAQKIVRNEWYKRICIISGSDRTEACHILAESIAKNDKSHFWTYLTMFWTEQQGDDLHDYVQTTGGPERNLVILNREFHEAWSRAEFVLKPRKQTQDDILELEFHWMSNKAPGHVEHNQGSHKRLVDARPTPPRLLETGDIIRLESIDIRKYPFPNADLLDLQYHMGRVLNACAGAEPLNLLKEDPPGGDAGALAENDVDADDSLISEFQQVLLDLAVERGAITEEHAQRWRDFYNGDNIETDRGNVRTEGESIPQHIQDADTTPDVSGRLHFC